MLSLKSAVATIVVPGTACFLLPYLILTRAHVQLTSSLSLVQGIAIVLAGLGIYMVVWVSTAFVRQGKGTPIPIIPPTRLVISGFYRFVRNPMYVGALLIILAEAVYFRSAALILYALAVWTALHVAILTFEEPQLKKRFGADYELYQKSVPRWIPKVRSR